MNKDKFEVPKAANPEKDGDMLEAFIEIVRLLRKHCPWDKEQTNDSISHLIIEESYEALDAIQKGNYEDFAKELGDLLLHIVMHSVIAEEEGKFDLKTVISKISDKMVLRHPHVFDDAEVTGEKQVLENWERIKMKEGRKSVLEGVPLNLPALLRAERIQHKASKVGFDWDNKEDVWAKVDEEYAELKNELIKGDKQKSFEEFGDFLFALVNAGRFEGIVPESALQFCNRKFSRRFEYIEAKAASAGKIISEMTLAEMDVLWNESKLYE